MTLSRLTGILLATAMMTACGGGGGDSATGGGGTPPSASMTAAEQQLGMDALTAINVHRASVSLPALTWYANGANVAYGHCLAMEAGNFFAHTDPNTNTTPTTRSSGAGIAHDSQGAIDPQSGQPFVGENLSNAAGSAPLVFTGQQAVNGWIASPGHLAQIVAPNLVAGATAMPAWTHCTVGVRVTPTEIWYTAMFWRNPTP